MTDCFCFLLHLLALLYPLWLPATLGSQFPCLWLQASLSLPTLTVLNALGWPWGLSLRAAPCPGLPDHSPGEQGRVERPCPDGISALWRRQDCLWAVNHRRRALPTHPSRHPSQGVCFVPQLWMLLPIVSWTWGNITGQLMAWYLHNYFYFKLLKDTSKKQLETLARTSD